MSPTPGAAPTPSPSNTSSSELAPRLARTADGVLPVGAVVTIEPGVYRAGWGGIRIEDDVVLTPTGAELLTHFPRQLLELA